MIGVIPDPPGATLEQHDAAITGMGYAPGGEGQRDDVHTALRSPDLSSS
jgi:hypothetical protein